MNASEKYDYIIAGSGLAGLSLVMHMLQSNALKDNRILLVDKVQKNKNDRTWCFWEKEEGIFESIVFKEWEHLFVYNHQFSKELQLHPYKYKLIKGIHFYDHCLQHIKSHSKITILNASVEEVVSEEETYIIAEGKKYYSQYIFNSIYQQPKLNGQQYWLLQHFKGWFIKTTTAFFDKERATLMDFRTDQKSGTAFFYVLPFSDTEALIEYTLFSAALLQDEIYDEALKHYISTVLGIDDYQIIEKELGVIPMTNYKFPAHQNNIINIGTAGGQTKGSSGYTFKFVQKNSKAIVEKLINGEHPASIKKAATRFNFYDSVLLNILHNKTLPGDKIFTQLFSKNKASKVFAFLDNESSLAEDISIISTLPILPFTKAAIGQIF